MGTLFGLSTNDGRQATKAAALSPQRATRTRTERVAMLTMRNILIIFVLAARLAWPPTTTVGRRAVWSLSLVCTFSRLPFGRTLGLSGHFARWRPHFLHGRRRHWGRQKLIIIITIVMSLRALIWAARCTLAMATGAPACLPGTRTRTQPPPPLRR